MNMFRLLVVLVLFPNCQSDNISSIIINTGIIGNDDLKISKVVNLSSKVNETSGLINFDGKLITHNDSGGKPYLYEIDIETGNIERTVKVSNAENRDIEDIAQDEEYIYLCDIGNNSNQRKDQTIYKISKADYLVNDNVTAKIIKIRYKEQTDFSKTNKSTNFDAEAVVVVGNDLFLFTKNWGNLETSVYKIPKTKGTYELVKIDSYDIGGLITGADYNKNTKTIVLTGYQDFQPFIVTLSGFSQNNPLDGKIGKKSIIVPGSIQIEGVASNPDSSYFLSAEKNAGLPAILYELKLN